MSQLEGLSGRGCPDLRRLGVPYFGVLTPYNKDPI